VYAITKCTVDRKQLFHTTPSAAHAVQGIFDTLSRLQSKGIWENLGCMVMPDHVHFMFKLQSGTLSEGMRRFSLLTTERICGALEMDGPIWQDGFYDHALRGERSMNAYLTYMAQNPVRAGLVSKAEDWPFQVGLLKSWPQKVAT
jgi:REP element-mobilizing transposase RayT